MKGSTRAWKRLLKTTAFSACSGVCVLLAKGHIKSILGFGFSHEELKKAIETLLETFGQFAFSKALAKLQVIFEAYIDVTE
jgi:hypothetical protein